MPSAEHLNDLAIEVRPAPRSPTAHLTRQILGGAT